MKKFYVLLIISLFFTFGYSQTTVLVPYTGNNSVSGCTNVTLQDHAGGSNYSHNANGHTILNASGSQTINISGTYSTESCCDRIRIYNGSGVSGTLLATYQGSGSVNYTGTAGQTLTVQFTSDGSVDNTGFSFSVTYTGCFTGPAPTLTTFTPSSGSCNNVVTINGTNFDNGTPIVKFNGVTAAHTYISATQLTAPVPAGATTGAITVQTSGGIASSSSNFTLNTSTPTISSISSSTGTRGTVITITGTNLMCPTAVTFGGTAAYSFNATSSTSISAEVGYGSSGNIAVTTAGGSATFAGFTYTAPSAANSVNISGSSTINNITNNVPTIVDNSLSMSSNGTVSGCIATITESYQSGDVLEYNTATGGALPAGISVAPFNATTRSLVFSGSALAADWEKILRNVTIQTTSAVCAPESRKVAFIVGDVYYNPLNNHFYKASTSNTSWTTAKTDAENISYFGKQGYLATPSSQAENSFISKLLSMNSWIGCSDNFQQINGVVGYSKYIDQNAAEGYWHWVTGPKKGTQIRTGNAQDYRVGSPISGIYQNWQANEPNDYLVNGISGNEDYGHMYTGVGDWNDFPNTSSIGSVIEFGDMPGDNTSGNINTVFTRNVYINGAPSGTITGGNVNVCSGTNSTTLTLTGLASGGTVARWEYSLDNFLTAGITVSSTSTSLTVSNITETRYYRAIVNTSGCSNLATSSVKITVATTNAGNIVSIKSAICTGGSTELTLSGNIGSVVRWERSTSSTFASGVTTISNTTTTLTEILNTAGTYYYRAVVQQSGCGSAVNSNGYPVTVSVGTPPVGGTISSTSSCSGTNNITLTLSGHSGNITKWQFSTDGGFVWTDVASTSTTLSQTNVTTSRKYRAIVSTATQACGNESSSSGEVTVFGTTVVRWDGAVSKNANNANNWCGGIPNNGQDIIINSTATNDLLLEQDREFGVIDFNGTSRKIELGNYNLIAKDIKGFGTNSYIKTNGTGKITLPIPTNTEKTFHIGNKEYNPIVITNKTTSADEFSVRVIDSVFIYGLNGVAVSNPHIKVTWDISKLNPNTGSGIDMKFTWNQSQKVGGISSYMLNHHNGSGWEIPTMGTSSVSGNSLTYLGYTGTFSPFVIGGSSTIALPIELSRFEVECNSEYNQVQWTTASEKNNDQFELYKSTDAKIWEKIYTIKGQGTKATETKYSFKDMEKQSNYYRLKDIDFDGKETWSQIISSACNQENEITSIYPNPAKDYVDISIPFEENSNYNIIDLNGKIMTSGSLLSRKTRVNIEAFASGVYIVEIVKPSEKRQLKIIKQ